MLKTNNKTSILTYLIISATIFWSLYSLLPRNYTAANASLDQFSADSAMVRVKEISKKPHFVGTEAHSEVRNYIVSELKKLGLAVEIQTQEITNVKWRTSAKVYNILARIPGENQSEALMLMSHYDSSPHASLGASDAGSGVATIIEGVRAFLSTKIKLKNDLIILITDGEELGLLGAKAFVKYHPWAKDVKLVLNFEARGSGGPSYMLLETNQGNKKLIEAFSKADNPFPVSNSIAYSIYKSLPNDTDLTVFREDGDIDGYNFAFIDDHFDYHTAQDSYERLDVNSLKHQGTYLMAMLHYFSKESIANLKSDEDVIFFNIAPFGMIYYPISWVMPMTILALLFFVFLLFYGIKQEILNIRKMSIGFLPLLLSLFLVGFFSFFGWKFLKLIYPQYADMINKFTYNGIDYIIAFSAFTCVIFLIIYQRFFKKHSIENLLVAPLFLWMMIVLLVPFKIIGTAYLIIPLFFGLVGFGFLLFRKKIKIPIWIHSLIAFPLLMLLVPFVYMLPVAMGLDMLWASAVLCLLILILLLPIFYQNNRQLKIILLSVGIVFLMKAHFNSDYTDVQKKPNSLVYLMNMDKNEAFWLSFDQELDRFTQQYLNEEKINQSKNLSFTSKFGTSITYQQKAEMIDLATPNIHIVKDTIINYQRHLSIKIYSNRSANKLEITALKPLRVFALNINGDEVKTDNSKVLFKVAKNKQLLTYYFTSNEPLTINLVVPSFEEFDVATYETKFDLLQNELIPIQPRTAAMMPKPYVVSDATIIVKRLTIPVYEN